MPELPRSADSLLVRTDFSDDSAWLGLCRAVATETSDGFHAYVQLVDDPANAQAEWGTLLAALPESPDRAMVLFVADRDAMTSTDFPILVVDAFGHTPANLPFRCVADQLWAVDNNLNLANMDWSEFEAAVDEDRIYRGF